MTDIKFTARLEGGVVVWDAPDGKPAKDHKTKIDEGAAPEEIEIKIKSDESVKDLGLKIHSVTPINVALDDGNCPANGINSTQIQLVSSDDDRVTIKDLNTGDACTLRYQVNVVDKDQNPHPCDPIIQNGGGGSGLT